MTIILRIACFGLLITLTAPCKDFIESVTPDGVANLNATCISLSVIK